VSTSVDFHFPFKVEKALPFLLLLRSGLHLAYNPLLAINRLEQWFGSGIEVVASGAVFVSPATLER
jgi:hypothetical protein